MTPFTRLLVRMLGGPGIRRRRPNPVLGIYRWRYEIGLGGGVAELAWVGHTSGWAVPAAVAAGIGTVFAVWPAARVSAADRARSVVVQHRLRTAFHEMCLTTWSGRTPAILWTAVGRDDLRVHLALPAGTAAWQFTPAVCATLAAACDVPAVRIAPNLRHPAFPVLVVTTRVPAGGRPASGPP
jgi:hypothetical protein